MSSWLAKRTGIHINLRPLVRPAAGTLGFMFGGPAGAAAASSVAGGIDDMAHGQSFKQALPGALKTAALTYGGAKVLPMLGRAMGMGGGDASAAGAGGAPGSSAGSVLPGDVDLTDVNQYGGYSADGASTAAPAAAGPSIPSPAGNLAQRALKGVGGFVQRNPTASLNAAGTALSSYTQNAQANKQLNFERGQVNRANAIQDEERRRREAIASAWVQAMAKAGNPMALQLAQSMGHA